MKSYYCINISEYYVENSKNNVLLYFTSNLDKICNINVIAV